MSELAWAEPSMGWPVAAGLDGILEGQKMAENSDGIKDGVALGYSAGDDDGTAHG